MRRAAAALLMLCCACGDDDDVEPPLVPALELPAVIALPYVEAGGGASRLDVTVVNSGTGEATNLVWHLDGDSGFAIDAAPAAVAAGASATLSLRWDGAATERIASATLTASSTEGMHTAEVWAVAGDPALGDADFAPVTGAGGVPIGESAVVAMPTAPFDGDPSVHIFVPDGYRERAQQDVVLHFHGFSTTLAATVPAHLYREQVYASGADVILVVPQGPVDTASGDFGRLMDPAGTRALLDEVMIVLYRAGVITRPDLGEVVLTSHSGGYQAVAANLDAPPFAVTQVDLFDSLYGSLATYQAYAASGGLLRSDYTATGGTDANNQSFATMLGAAGVDVATAPTQPNLRDAAALIYFVATSHEGSTREAGAFGEQLRWGVHASRRGPRVELRSAVARAGTATVTWLSPPDDDLAGWRVETSIDGAAWTLAAETDAAATSASFPLAAGARVRVVPVVAGVADPQPSDVYRVDPDADVLVVDGFDRVLDGSFGGLDHDFAALVGEAAGAVHGVSNEAVSEDAFDLGAYRAVIWLVGDESVDDHTFTAEERAAIDAYLAAGGRVVLSGSEIGYELGGSADGAAWLAATAGAVFASDDAGTLAVSAAGLLDFGFAGPGAPYAEEYPDSFTPTGAGGVVLSYQGGAAAAVGIDGRAVIVGFPLELIDGDANRATVVRALLTFVAP